MIYREMNNAKFKTVNSLSEIECGTVFATETGCSSTYFADRNIEYSYFMKTELVEEGMVACVNIGTGRIRYFPIDNRGNLYINEGCVPSEYILCDTDLEIRKQFL